MTSYTVHVHASRPVVLVAERFSLGALLLGPLWLLFQAAWIPAVLLGCAWVAAMVLSPAAMLGPVAVGLALFAGLTGPDMLRWALARRGWRLSQVVVAGSAELALGRLLRFRPGLGAAELGRRRGSG